jgi:CBS domain-containing protein
MNKRGKIGEIIGDLMSKPDGIVNIMSKSPVTCQASDSLHAAARLMWEHDCGAIPVVAGDGRLIGIITDRDICMATYTQALPPQSISVGQAMARQVFAIGLNDTIEQVERLMREKQVHRVPVVDADAHPIGMVSLNDLAHHALAGREKRGLERGVAQTLAAISRPRSTAVQS